MFRTSLITALLIIAFLLGEKAVAEAEPRLNPSPFGLMGFPYSHAHNDPASLQKAEDFMQLYKLTGARWDRRDFWWSVVQPDRDTWNWEYFDAAMQDFRAANVNLVVILCYGSAWTGHAPDTEEEMQLFGEYVYRMVDRYKGHVKHWEVWNEPNILPFWAPKPNVANYTRLLQISYQRAKEADPDCVILGGAMAGADLPFLRGMYENGAKGYFDELSFHSYGNNPTEESIAREMDGLKGVMAEYGDQKPIWLTETGIYTGPAGVTEQLQAERSVKESLIYISHGLERIFQLTLKDWTDSTSEQDAMSYRGLLNFDSTAKKFLFAHRTMDAILGDKEFIGRVNLHPQATFLLFGNRDQDVLVAWTPEGEELTAELDLDSVAVIAADLYGTKQLLNVKKSQAAETDENRPPEVPRAESGDVIAVSLSQSPTYLIGTGERVRLAAQLEFRNLRESAPPGAALDFEAAWAGIAPIPPDRAFTINGSPEGRLKPLPLKATIPADAEGDAYDLPLNITFGDLKPITIYRPIELAPPLTARFRQYDRLTLPTGEFPLSLESNLDEPIQVTLALQGDSRFRLRSSGATTLRPGEETVLPVEVDMADLKSGEKVELSIIASSTNSERTSEAALIFTPLKVFRRTGEVKIDGDLSEWEKYEKNLRADMMKEEDFNPNLNGGADDISASGWLAWDDEALYLALEVRDDAIHLAKDTVLWNFDSLQVGFDMANDGVANVPYDQNDYELEIAKLRDGSNLIYPGHFPPGLIESVVKDETDLAIVVDKEKHTIRYELRIPGAILPPLELVPGRVFGFNFIHNDNDEGHELKREGWLELAPGIGYGKDPVLFHDAILWAE
jgi:hypothetical protein